MGKFFYTFSFESKAFLTSHDVLNLICQNQLIYGYGAQNNPPCSLRPQIHLFYL